MTTTPPPRLPYGTQIRYKDGQIVVGQLWQKWTAPLHAVTVQTVDNAGAKKRAVTVVFATPDGRTRRHRIKPAMADRALAWAVAFNAWQEATARG